MAEETQVTIRVDRAEYREFRAECIRRDITPTGMIQDLIRRQVQAWESATAQAQSDRAERDARQLNLFIRAHTEDLS